MLIPFRTSVTGIVAEVCGRFVVMLEEKLQLGGQLAIGTKEQDIWEALQCEVSLEKVFWGDLRSTGMSRHAYGQLKPVSVNLGPGHNVPSMCKTDELGFLALTHYAESVTDTSPLPPFGTWTASVLQVVHILTMQTLLTM